jgi:uncharacterized protein YndB with AHSA1/START domain
MSKATEKTTKEATEPESAREMVITRLIDAPRERVWQAWTDPKQIALWWGPNGFSTTTHEHSLKPGGVWRHTMRGPDGVEYPNQSVFQEIVPPERLVYTHGGGTEGKEGVSFRATITFKAVGNKTELTMRSVFPSKEARERVVRDYGALEGGRQHLQKLAAWVEIGGSQPGEFVFRRELPVARAKAFAAWTDAKQLAKWWGPNGFTAPRCEVDAKPGGKIHVDMRAPDGSVEAMRGSFREVVAPERLVFDTSVPDPNGNPIEVLILVAFVESGGKTTMTVRGRVLRIDPSAAKLLNGMNQGWEETLDRFVASVATG